MTSAKRRATYEGLRKVPENMVAEIIDGELFTSPRPASPHALATSMIGFARPAARRPDGNPRAMGLGARGGTGGQGWAGSAAPPGRVTLAGGPDPRADTRLPFAIPRDRRQSAPEVGQSTGVDTTHCSNSGDSHGSPPKYHG